MDPVKRSKILPIIASCITMGIGLFSLLMTILAYRHYKNFVCIMAATGIIISTLFYMGIVFNNMLVHHKYIVYFVFGIINVSFSLTFIWLHDTMWVTIVLCSCLLVTSVIKIILSPDRIGQIKYEMPAFFVAFILFFNIIDSVFWLMLVIISSLLIGIAILYLIYVFTPLFGRRIKKLDSIKAKVEINE